MIHLVTALRCEATPLRSHLGLKPVCHQSPYPVFGGNDCMLIVSGVGRVAAAGATATLSQLSGGQRNQPWLNVGVAGHANAPLGQPLLAHKVRDTASDEVWYPSLVLSPPCPTVEVRTVSSVERTYADGAAYDMEAAGYYPTANRVATAELVMALKVISDNRDSPPEQISADRIAQLIGDSLPVVDRLISQLTELTCELSMPDHTEDLELFLDQWHFSTTEPRRLVRLLRRWRALSGGRSAWGQSFAEIPTGAEAMRHLSFELETLALAQMQ